MSKLRWIIFAAVTVLILGGLVLLANNGKKDVSNINPNSIIAGTDDTIGDHVYGKADAKVILFEYGDFQCPSCGGAYPQIKKIKETYKDTIAFVFRNLPLTTIHPNALAAASAAEAAGLQGKFWEMHNALYENQDAWSSASASERNTFFEDYARTVGVDVNQFNTDLTSKKVTDKIARDRAIAKKLNLSATPSFLINDQKVSDEVVSNVVSGDGSKLAAELDKALKAAGIQPPTSN